MKWIGKGKIPTKNADKVKLANAGFAIAKELFNVELYFHQALIFSYGIDKTDKYQRVLAITTSRYGKSFTLALIALYRAKFLNEKILIMSADDDKANIILSEINSRLQNSHTIFRDGLDPTDKFERLATTISKKGLSYYNAGQIHSVSLKAQNGKSQAIGFGADCMIIDESALVDNTGYDMAMRMLLESPNFKLIEISNPHRKNHFFKSYNSNEYKVIHINHETAIQEGRISQELVNSLRDSMTERNFRIFVECEFVDKDDSIKLFDVNNFKWSKELSSYSTVTMGVDLARFGDYTVVCGFDFEKRMTFYKRLPHEGLDIQEEKIINIWRSLGCPIVRLDARGLGVAVADSLLNSMGSSLIPIQASNKSNLQMFSNLSLLSEKRSITLLDDLDIKQEIAGFERHEGKNGMITFSNGAEDGDADHDDIVYSIALACLEFTPQNAFSSLGGLIPQ